jgi:hypothetical protein
MFKQLALINSENINICNEVNNDITVCFHPHLFKKSPHTMELLYFNLDCRLELFGNTNNTILVTITDNNNITTTYTIVVHFCCNIRTSNDLALEITNALNNQVYSNYDISFLCYCLEYDNIITNPKPEEEDYLCTFTILVSNTCTISFYHKDSIGPLIGFGYGVYEDIDPNGCGITGIKKESITKYNYVESYNESGYIQYNLPNGIPDPIPRPNLLDFVCDDIVDGCIEAQSSHHECCSHHLGSHHGPFNPGSHHCCSHKGGSHHGVNSHKCCSHNGGSHHGPINPDSHYCCSHHGGSHHGPKCAPGHHHCSHYGGSHHNTNSHHCCSHYGGSHHEDPIDKHHCCSHHGGSHHGPLSHHCCSHHGGSRHGTINPGSHHCCSDHFGSHHGPLSHKHCSHFGGSHHGRRRRGDHKKPNKKMDKHAGKQYFGTSAKKINKTTYCKAYDKQDRIYKELTSIQNVQLSKLYNQTHIGYQYQYANQNRIYKKNNHYGGSGGSGWGSDGDGTNSDEDEYQNCLTELQQLQNTYPTITPYTYQPYNSFQQRFKEPARMHDECCYKCLNRNTGTGPGGGIQNPNGNGCSTVIPPIYTNYNDRNCKMILYDSNNNVIPNINHPGLDTTISLNRSINYSLFYDDIYKLLRDLEIDLNRHITKFRPYAFFQVTYDYDTNKVTIENKTGAKFGIGFDFMCDTNFSTTGSLHKVLGFEQRKYLGLTTITSTKKPLIYKHIFSEDYILICSDILLYMNDDINVYPSGISEIINYNEIMYSIPMSKCCNFRPVDSRNYSIELYRSKLLNDIDGDGCVGDECQVNNTPICINFYIRTRSGRHVQMIGAWSATMNIEYN